MCADTLVPNPINLRHVALRCGSTSKYPDAPTDLGMAK